MRRIVGFAAVLGLVTVAACGGSVDVTASSGGGGGAGAGTGASTGTGAGTTTSSTGTTGSSTTTSSTSTGTTGAGGATPVCSTPQGKACTQPSDCVFAETSCCICGRPELSDLAAVNVSYATLCSCGGPVCDCASSPNPNLALSCEAGECAGWDVRKDALSACTKDSECRLRAGLSCCEACDATPSNLVAVRTDAEGALASRVCSPGEDCPGCIPQYPPDAIAQCIDGQCEVVTGL